ncbi:MAG: 16S rRNA (uracil(1498)-N(3))-methyltransferase [candidate division KSB1 bacterium]|nr:16S rRNA (uracil(1498)-N(3))-methyltransferase [candidate division KSB1 bacterium]
MAPSPELGREGLPESPYQGASDLAGLDVYYAPGLTRGQAELALEGEEFHHLFRVGRHRVGDRVAVTNGCGMLAKAQIVAINRGRAILRLEQWFLDQGESAVELHLGVGMIQSQRWDWLVEKATELGVRRLTPLRTRFVQGGTKEGKVERWRRVAVAALKQCQRSVLLRVDEPMALDDWLDTVDGANAKFVADARATLSLAEWVRREGDSVRGAVAALVGPEGGLAPEEIAKANGRGFVAVNLGPRRLRTETAALLLSALLLNIAAAKEPLEG